MTDRATRLRDLAAYCRSHETVVDAWTAKSFTDRLFVIEIERGADLPVPVRERVRDCGLRGYNEVHDVNADSGAFAGQLNGGDRYRFVDIRTRGELQSYVVD